MIYVVIRRHYPDFEQLLNAVPDYRKRHTYEVAELLSAGLLMFVLRCGSRNQLDQHQSNTFENNYLKIFGMRLPITDTVHVFLEKLSPIELEKLRELLVRRLMERKVFEKWKFSGYYNLSFDGTGVHCFDHESDTNSGLTYKETKNDIKWYANVLEAKLVFSNGFSISLGSEWLENQNGKFDKQDCEREAFKRLAARIKTSFPRLAILVSADALYCCEPIFDLMKEYGWKFVFTYKDKCLRTFWKTIGKTELRHKERVIGKNQNDSWLYESTQWANDLPYKSHHLSFLEYRKYDHQTREVSIERFVHLTNFHVDEENAAQLSTQGRMRWKIENEGFNTQKNQGWELQHKYARKNINAIKNYYLLLQIAHMISQLVEKLQSIKIKLNQSDRTLQSLIGDALAELKKIKLSLKEMIVAYRSTSQLRY